MSSTQELERPAAHIEVMGLESSGPTPVEITVGQPHELAETTRNNRLRVLDAARGAGVLVMDKHLIQDVQRVSAGEAPKYQG